MAACYRAEWQRHQAQNAVSTFRFDSVYSGTNGITDAAFAEWDLALTVQDRCGFEYGQPRPAEASALNAGTFTEEQFAELRVKEGVLVAAIAEKKRGYENQDKVDAALAQLNDPGVTIRWWANNSATGAGELFAVSWVYKPDGRVDAKVSSSNRAVKIPLSFETAMLRFPKARVKLLVGGAINAPATSTVR